MTDKEWTWAATGGAEGRRFPWGAAAADCERAVMKGGCGKKGTEQVGSRASGDSRDGLKDLAGNVYEWTSSLRPEDPYVEGEELEPLACCGSWRDSEQWRFEADNCVGMTPVERDLGVGIRCARTAARAVQPLNLLKIPKRSGDLEIVVDPPPDQIGNDIGDGSSE